MKIRPRKETYFEKREEKRKKIGGFKRADFFWKSALIPDNYLINVPGINPVILYQKIRLILHSNF
jgi:hypothetical protein